MRYFKLIWARNNNKRILGIVVFLFMFMVSSPIEAKKNMQAPDTKPKPVVFLVNGFQNCCVSAAASLIDNLITMDVDQDASSDLRFVGIEVRNLNGSHYSDYVIPWNSLYNTQDGTSGFAGQGIVDNPDKTSDERFLREVSNYINSLPVGTPLIFIGHSFGGDSIMKLLPMIDKSSYRILFVGVVDPIKNGGLRPIHSVPTNVEYFFNRWQSNVPYPFNLWSTGEFICAAKSCDQTEQNFHREADGTAERVRCSDLEVCDGAEVTIEQQCALFICTDLPVYDPGTKNKPVNHQSIAWDDYVQKQMIDAIRNMVSNYKANEATISSPNQWSRLKQPNYDQIHVMPDGSVLGWNSSSGVFRLWKYNSKVEGFLTNPNGNEVSGQWSRLKQPDYDQIHVMIDGRVLGWNSQTGAYRLWDYSPLVDGLLTNPNGNEVSGQWSRLKQPDYDQIHVMIDGRVLGWNSQTGAYRLWDYSPLVDGLLTNPNGNEVSGQWSRLKQPDYDQIHVMIDGRVLGWNSQTGAYRLWQYEPTIDGLLTNPSGSEVSGQWSELRQPSYDQIQVMPDGWVLGWNSQTGYHRLWEYSPTTDGLLSNP